MNLFAVFASAPQLQGALFHAHMGVVLAMATMSLVFWLWLHDRLYPLFSAFIVSGLALTVVRDALPNLAHIESEQRAAQTLAVVQCVFNVFSTAFFAALFEFRKNGVWAARLFQAVVLLNLASLAASLCGYHARVMPATNTLALVSTTFGFGFVVWMLALRRWRYLLPALAYAVPTFVGLMALARRVELLPNELHLDTGSPAGFALKFVALMMLGVAVARRTREAEAESRRERTRALDIALQAEAVLERRVQARTDELAKSNQQLLTEVEQRRVLERDLQQSLEAQQQVVALQRQFVGTVSHEFRTPLAIIDAVAQSLARPNAATGADFLPRVAKIRRAVNRLSTLLTNVLAEERLNTTLPGSLRTEAVDVRDLVGESSTLLTAQDAGRLRVQLPDAPVMIAADRTLVDIVLLNLIQNALKYSPVERPVSLAVHAAAGCAHVDVQDQGPGIAPEERERIFGKFHRSEGSASVPGTGLGLYLAREIARQHGGDVTLLDSSAEGSVFRLTMPLSAAGADPDGA
ncbi:sensor histidine kinase [Variovorax guangxiensis]|uniref:histidine kinase n=1 Tax=Variovorax guangxiensis TaxID=1775474 RepID=A0A502DJX6_9BURK|nr:sensor histidine kinase [Variovorax guangxiensis]TPG20658.1 histidine kinase [Variovorax ginsengisoli]TPG25755.1 histidine kinase [Variovorax guangxiensis]